MLELFILPKLVTYLSHDMRDSFVSLWFSWGDHSPALVYVFLLWGSMQITVLVLISSILLCSSVVGNLWTQNCCRGLHLGNQFFWSVGSRAGEGIFWLHRITIWNRLPTLSFLSSFIYLGRWSYLMIIQSLATQVRKQLNASRTKGEPVQGFNFSTTTMLTRYLEVWKSLTLLKERKNI